LILVGLVRRAWTAISQPHRNDEHGDLTRHVRAHGSSTRPLGRGSLRVVEVAGARRDLAAEQWWRRSPVAGCAVRFGGGGAEGKETTGASPAGAGSAAAEGEEGVRWGRRPVLGATGAGVDREEEVGMGERREILGDGGEESWTL
jgi:hypothetical protein